MQYCTKETRAASSRTNTRRGKVDWEREANGITADIPERAILLDISTVLV